MVFKKTNTLKGILKQDYSYYFIFLLKFPMVLTYLFIISQIICFNLPDNKFCEPYLKFISPILSLGLGIFINRTWERYNRNTIYKKQGKPAINMLETLQTNIKDRISFYQASGLRKDEVIQYLKEIIKNIDTAKYHWENLNIENDPLDDFLVTKEKTDDEIDEAAKRIK
ncbi:MAG: hypothetical protein PHT54_04720 [Candidatus Nanoarchaeia archaeon]|nr:hypothetical protein [Candidatus Nanoarchaeia archaeon]